MQIPATTVTDSNPGTPSVRASLAPSQAAGEAPWPFLTLSRSELGCLVEHGVLTPTAESPVSLVLETPDPEDEDDALGAAERLLDKGLVCRITPRFAGAAEPAASEAGALFRRALEVLAAPEARLVIIRQSPDEEPSLIPLFVAGELAAPGFIDDEGLHVGAPMDRTQLLESIHVNLQSDDSEHLEHPVTLSPLVLQAVETLWRGTRRPFSQPVSRAQAHTLLEHLLGDREMARGLLRFLCDIGVLGEEHGAYRLAEPYLPWMERVLSGHSCAVEYLPLGAEGSRPPEPDRLLFFGPPGQRVLCTQPEAEAAAVTPRKETPWNPVATSPRNDGEGAGDGQEEGTLFFSAPSDRLLTWKLRHLLGS